MRSNVDRRTRQIEQHEHVERVHVDYDDGELVAQALMTDVEEQYEDAVEAFEETVEDLGLSMETVKNIGFGLEVTVR